MWIGPCALLAAVPVQPHAPAPAAALASPAWTHLVPHHLRVQLAAELLPVRRAVYVLGRSDAAAASGARVTVRASIGSRIADTEGPGGSVNRCRAGQCVLATNFVFHLVAAGATCANQTVWWRYAPQPESA
jgi:hypothetical protein